MPQLARSCPSCARSLPDDAAFCPSCGASTPTGSSGPTERLGAEAVDQAEHRRRLQRALGDAYELRRLIGAGGFAEVYAAWDTKLKREVAIKALRPELAPSATMLERFRREAVAVAKSPVLVAVGEAGLVAAGVLSLLLALAPAALPLAVWARRTPQN